MRTRPRFRSAAGVGALLIGLGTAVIGPGISGIPGVAVAGAAVTSEVIVRIEPPLTIDALNAAHRTTAVDSIPGLAGAYLLVATDGRTVDQLVAELGAVPGVEYAAPNSPISNSEVDGLPGWGAWAASTPTAAGAQWAKAALRLAEANRISSGAGTTVAVLDTGVQASHPDLAGVLVGGTDLAAGDGVPDDERNGIDDNGNGKVDEMAGHGTHVAGIVHMIAPAARIMPVRVLNSDGTGTTFNVVKGMFWAADHGARIVNMSLGTRGSANLVKDGADALLARQVVVVAAAGNDGRQRDNYPAARRCVLSVTSTGASGAISPYSTLGKSVVVNAPGQDIVSAFPYSGTGYASWSGTSMASPFVAGQVALLRSASPGLTVSQVLRYVAGTTTPTPGGAGVAGSGRIDPLASLQALRADALPSIETAGIDKHCR